MKVKDLSKNAPRRTRPRVSRARRGGGILPLLLGLGCAALVLAGMWLAYTYG
jgi:ferric-dicitrate binding protein FerR (iron transport regulator)